MRRWLILTLLFGSTFTLGDEKSLTVKIEGMTCPACAASVERQFKNIPQIQSIDLSIRRGLAKIKLKDGETLPDEKIIEAVTKAGYKATSIKRK